METHFPPTNQTKVAGERVIADLKTLVSDSESLLKATADDISDKAREARTRLLSALDRAKSTCQAFQAQSIQSGRAALRNTDATIRGHPYESLALALGAGVLLGLCIARRER